MSVTTRASRVNCWPIGHTSILQPLIWHNSCWYLNESSLHQEFEYIIIILIQSHIIVATGRESRSIRLSCAADYQYIILESIFGHIWAYHTPYKNLYIHIKLLWLRKWTSGESRINIESAITSFEIRLFGSDSSNNGLLSPTTKYHVNSFNQTTSE